MSRDRKFRFLGLLLVCVLAVLWTVREVAEWNGAVSAFFIVLDMGLLLFGVKAVVGILRERRND